MFFHRVIFIVDFESELKIDKKFVIYPVSAISAIFCTFARTYPITLKFHQNIKDVILIKNHEKKFARNMVNQPKLQFENSKIAKISILRKFDIYCRNSLFSRLNYLKKQTLS